MDTRHRIGGVLLAAVACGAALSTAGASEDKELAANELRLPIKGLALDDAIAVTEGTRMLADSFPYLQAMPRGETAVRKTDIVPDALANLLKTPSEGSTARIAGAGAAIEAVRLFVAGPLVTDGETAERIVATGRELGERLKHLRVTLTDHRPESWTPTATPLPSESPDAPSGGWRVSLAAFEMDRMLRLVHVTAVVTASGQVELERKPIVDGPMTSWQTAVMGEWTDAMEKRQQEMLEEARVARKAYAAALRPARTLHTLWATGRLLHDLADVRDLLGPPDRDIGSGIHIWTYDLDDGTSVIFGGANRVLYVRHVRNAKGPLASFETIGSIYVAPTR